MVPNLPIVGSHYTIKDMEPGHRGMGLRLLELDNPLIPIRVIATGVEYQFIPTFIVSRFRRALDISTFTNTMTPEKLSA